MHTKFYTELCCKVVYAAAISILGIISESL
jgi:hypothetical protein